MTVLSLFGLRISRTFMIASAIALASGAAHAQTDAAAAQALYDQAKALAAQGKYNEACPKLEESQRLDPASGTLLNLADCYEQVGRTASAWSTFLEAATAARNAGNPEREQEARLRAARLADKLSKITIDVRSAIEGLEVRRDGAVVGRAQWGIQVPIDPGAHTISARAPRRIPWSTNVAVAPDGKVTVVVVPQLANAPATTAAGPSTPLPGPPLQTESPVVEASRGLGMQRKLALAAGGVGVVGLGIGTVFGLKAMARSDEAEKYCNGNECTNETGVTAGNDAHSAGNVATIAMVVGAVGIAGGLTLWFTAPAEQVPAGVGVGPGSLQLRGAF